MKCHESEQFFLKILCIKQSFYKFHFPQYSINCNLINYEEYSFGYTYKIFFMPIHYATAKVCYIGTLCNN